MLYLDVVERDKAELNSEHTTSKENTSFNSLDGGENLKSIPNRHFVSNIEISSL